MTKKPTEAVKKRAGGGANLRTSEKRRKHTSNNTALERLATENRKEDFRSMSRMQHKKHVLLMQCSPLYVILNMVRCMDTWLQHPEIHHTTPDPFNTVRMHLGGVYNLITEIFAYEPKHQLMRGEITREQYDEILPRCLSSLSCNVMHNLSAMLVLVCDRVSSYSLSNYVADDWRELTLLEEQLKKNASDRVAVQGFLLGVACIFPEFYTALVDGVKCPSENFSDDERELVRQEKLRCRVVLQFAQECLINLEKGALSAEPPLYSALATFVDTVHMCYEMRLYPGTPPPDEQ